MTLSLLLCLVITLQVKLVRTLLLKDLLNPLLTFSIVPMLAEICATEKLGKSYCYSQEVSLIEVQGSGGEANTYRANPYRKIISSGWYMRLTFSAQLTTQWGFSKALSSFRVSWIIKFYIRIFSHKCVNRN